MCQNTPQAMGEDMLDIFVPHPGVIPGPGGPKMAKKQPRLGTKFRNQVWPHGHIFLKDPGVFRRPGQNVEDLCNFGTSRTSNELKIGP